MRGRRKRSQPYGRCDAPGLLTADTIIVVFACPPTLFTVYLGQEQRAYDPRWTGDGGEKHKFQTKGGGDICRDGNSAAGAGL